MNRRTAWLLLILFLLLGSLYGLFVWRSNYQNVTIQFVGQSQKTAKVYRSIGDSESSPNEKDLVQTIADTTTIRLKKGGYLLVTDGTDSYAAFETTFNNREGPVTITVNPDYNESKLVELTKTEQPKISNLLFSSYPVAQNKYSFQKGSVLGKGDWFVSLLRPIDENADTLRVVAHKTGNDWSLVTKPPVLVVSKVEYTEVPPSVLEVVNTLE